MKRFERKRAVLSAYKSWEDADVEVLEDHDADLDADEWDDEEEEMAFSPIEPMRRPRRFAEEESRRSYSKKHHRRVNLYK